MLRAAGVDLSITVARSSAAAFTVVRLLYPADAARDLYGHGNQAGRKLGAGAQAALTAAGGAAVRRAVISSADCCTAYRRTPSAALVFTQPLEL